jgi:Flp pilus assembly protein TadG
MADERITTVSDGTTVHTTVTDAPRTGGGGWLLGLIAVLLLGALVYFFAVQSGSVTNKNNAVAGAAKDVGDAARDVGNAARDAADDLKKR